ncbi:phosphoribosylpyrophosphate synthetase [Xanthomarina sp. F1114]|uniref:phosphoribosylpyrophosphate synthetase n=1 Tax=Xanthomarina sp. F1114 TaxID=2996019 RepID=UPI00225DD057|nr:phosphoribosylpyrophosphate synthetase [Xanthomarina sp. F1114]MCX7548956.1 phosphoribosylpyrophosphate synthetase [Xanthomarina sp. F1114]
MKNTYTSLSKAINDLTKKGYIYNFNMKEDFIECAENCRQLQPEEFEIDQKYRFQEMSDVDNESVLYAISSTDGKIKGLLVNAYGIYADYASFKLVQKLNRPEVK